MQGVLDEGLERLRSAGHQANGTLLTGDTVGEITRYATEIQSDLIVVGHKHLDGWAARWWKTSVSEALIAHAPCGVLVAITAALIDQNPPHQPSVNCAWACAVVRLFQLARFRHQRCA